LVAVVVYISDLDARPSWERAPYWERERLLFDLSRDIERILHRALIEKGFRPIAQSRVQEIQRQLGIQNSVWTAEASAQARRLVNATAVLLVNVKLLSHETLRRDYVTDASLEAVAIELGTPLFIGHCSILVERRHYRKYSFSLPEIRYRVDSRFPSLWTVEKLASQLPTLKR
ncbi:MAG: hypothetical protein KDB14_30820, partial [Planctomycetales bacterium]|nr:hypothetical protein [Planctomycetales bacterium]